MPPENWQGRGKMGASIGAARQQSILALIAKGDVVSVGEVAQRFGVSQETVRRDIRSLEEGGHLRRVHGGAAPLGTVDLTARRPVVERLEVDRGAKIRAAEAALSLFEDGMNVFLGASSTMLLLAEQLAESDTTLTVTTNMIDIATILASSKRGSVTLLGGVVHPETRSVGGYETLESLELRLFDLCVFGGSSVSAVHGFLGPSQAHRVLVTTVSQRSHRTAFVMDSAKFARSDAHVVLPLQQADVLATDTAPPDALRRALEQADVTVVLPTGRAMGFARE